MPILRFKRATASRWEQFNPILDEGEPGFEKNTGKFKIGDGVTAWNDLEYFATDSGVDIVVEEPTSPELNLPSDSALLNHVNSSSPHPAYDDGTSLFLLYQNAKV